LSSAAAQQSWSVLDLLRWTTQHFSERGIETPRLDAECLLAKCVNDVVLLCNSVMHFSLDGRTFDWNIFR
jgi:hypothetical protein